MKRKFVFSTFHLICLVAFIIFITFVSPALAEEGSGDWRKTYDLVMMWVNFLILAAVMYKLLKNPLKDFIQGRKYEMERELQKAEEQKKLADEKIRESVEMLEQGKEKFERVRQRIIEQGEKKRDQIIKEAEEQSAFMITEAKRNVDNQIVKARKSFKLELVDKAFEIALERLPEEVTEEDDQKYIEKYISSAAVG